MNRPKFRPVDGVFLIILGILTIIAYFIIQNPESVELIQFWDYEVLKILGPAIWTSFLVCIVGNLLPVPTPYSFVVWFAGFQLREQNLLFPALVALGASVGCLIGEMVGYLVGRGSSEITTREYETIEKIRKELEEHPRLAPVLIFIFGLTPLNDDLLTVPLGFIKYPMKKTILYCWLGKLGMVLILAYLPFRLEAGAESLWISILSLYGVVIMVYLLLRVDWFAYISKLRAKLWPSKVEGMVPRDDSCGVNDVGQPRDE